MNSWRQVFPILVADDELGLDTAGGRALQDIIQQLQAKGFTTIEAHTVDDGRSLFLSRPNIGAVLLDWDLDAGTQCTPGELVSLVRERNEDVPIFLLTEKLTIGDIPLPVLRLIHGYLWKLEDTPRFIAGRIEEAWDDYFESLLSPFFGGLIRYSEEYKYAWHTPGHSGGVAFLKSPVGRVFFDFFGENALRSDLSVSVPELGSLLGHSGVVGEAEANAARVFGADRTYFVTGGTSAANRIVFHATVNPGDIVLVDRNCHQSVMHAIAMTGAIPIYLLPNRNRHGIIGPLPPGELTPQAVREKLASHPLTRGLPRAEAKLAVITNSTYDGLCYDVAAVQHQLRGVAKYVLFDEAWYAYARFHPLYRNRYAMCEQEADSDEPVVFATQSTHKVLAAFSQGSMVHVRDRHVPAADRVDHERFNQAFMMHTSTSPQYAIIGSLDVATQ
ncbi:MAG: Orn/Lys/Arg decarboxylase N-terminal domain-containing protein [Candidatus Bipolaricaulaceae bacterium]